MKLLKYKKLGIALIMAAILALPVVSFAYYRFSKSSIEFDAVSLADRVRVGEAFDVKVSIKNESSNSLQKVQLVFKLPDGIISADGDKSKIQRITVGDIGKNGEHEEIVKLIALPGESIRDIEITMGYAVGNLTANFSKSKLVSIEVLGLPYELSITAPDKVLAGQEFETVVDYKYSGEEESPDIKLVIDYPQEFTKTKSMPKSDFVENAWIIKKLTNGEKGKISLSGSVDLPEGSNLIMTVRLLIKILEKEYPILVKEASIPIAPSPLSLQVFLSQTREDYHDGDALRAGDMLNYTIIYKNNTDVVFNNLKITAKLTGQMYDFGSLKVNNAVFNALTKTLTWDVGTLPGLGTLDAASSASVTFSINVANAYPIRKLNDKNFTVKVDARIESPTVPALISALKTVNSAALQSKIAGMVAVDARALYRDAESLILNSGSLPPMVGQSTNFTIHWSLTNFATDVKDVEVRAKLEEGVVFTDKVKGNTTTLPEYDKETKEVVWRLDKMFATTGITGDKPEVIFQVKATPKFEMVGNYMPLVAETKVKAIDEFTGLELVGTDAALTTQLSDDSTVKENEGKVIP